MSLTYRLAAAAKPSFGMNLFVLGAVAASLLTTPASATVTLGGSGAGTTLTTSGASGGSGVFNFNGFVGSSAGVIAGLTAKLTLAFNSITNSGTTFNFGYTLDNTATSPVTASRISRFGFDVAPDVTSASSTGTYDFAALGGNQPNGIGVVEVCFRDLNNGNCTGGPGGLLLGQSGSGTLALTFATAQTAITLSNFFTRYQSLDYGDVTGGSASGQVTDPSSPVPEPAAWMLMLLGFGGIGLAMRKNRSTITTTARVRFV